MRITGGQWRSRLLPVANLPGLRPTPDRVRETLFNWLGQDLRDQRCLDLFAGTGILGFEAASRGAAAVTLLERHPKAVAALRAAAASLEADQVEVVRGNALEFALGARQPYDLLFLDPPYNQGLLERIAPKIGALASVDAALYVECEHPLEGLGDFVTVRSGTAGQVHFHLMRGQHA